MDEMVSIMRASFYEKVDPRRKQERVDSNMVQEDHRAMANLSNQPVYREFNAWKHPERLAMFDQSDKTSGKGE